MSARRCAVSGVVASVLSLAACSSDGGGGIPSGPDVPFAPTSNTTLSGNSLTFKSVAIPANVTITVSSDLVLTVVGDFSNAGTLKGDCVALTIRAGGLFANPGGTIRNDCTTEPDDPPGILVIGEGGIDADGGEIASSGDLRMTTDPAQTLASPPLTAGETATKAPGTMNATSVPCRYHNYTARSIPAKRGKAKDGTPKGDPGKDGRYKDLGPCSGGILLDGLTLNGQSGGDGGNGTWTGSTTAEGGKGGNMGAVLITATGGDIVFSGTNTINTGNGGDAGSGTATGLASSNGGSATALGGAGGDESPTHFGGSPLTIQTSGGSIIVNGALNISLGHAGKGGAATATGAAGGPGQPGGSATATGGKGGKTADKKFQASGSVGGTGTINLSGGDAGLAGDATANGGTGGAGAAGAPGGKGGAMTARGGDGGNAELRNQAGQLIGAGGDAGNATMGGGTGGPGGSNCPNGAGGAGGAGGDVSGGPGTAGTGAAAGSAGTTTIANAGNGGKGGDGNGPGGGGLPGANGTTTPGANSFQPGAPGGACPPPGAGITETVSPATQTVSQGGQGSVQVTITRVGGFTGAVTVTIKDDQNPANTLATQTVPAGSTQATISFPVGTTFPTGNHTFTATASGTGVTSVDKTFGVTVNPASAPGVTLAVSPATQTVGQGGQGSVHADITRTGTFAGDVTVTIKDDQNPANTLATATIPAGSTQADVVFPIGATFPAGAHTFTATASGTGVTPVSQTFGVTITQTSGTSGSIKFCDSNKPILVMSQSGTGAWQSLTNQGQDTYSFTITGPYGGLAWVEPLGFAGYQIHEYLATAQELVVFGQGHCGTSLGDKSIHVVANGMPLMTTGYMGLGGGNGYLVGTAGGTVTQDLLNIADGAHDFVAARSTAGSVDRMHIGRALNLADGSTYTFDFLGGSGSFAPENHTVFGIPSGPDAIALVASLFTAPGDQATLTYFQVASGQTSASFPSLPAAQRLSTDLQVISGIAEGASSFRYVVDYFLPGTDHTIAFGAPVTAPTITTAALTPYVRPCFAGPIQSDYSDNQEFYVGTSIRGAYIEQTKAYHQAAVGGSNYDACLGDFTPASGWQNTYGPQPGQVNWSVTVTGWNLGGGGFFPGPSNGLGIKFGSVGGTKTF